MKALLKSHVLLLLVLIMLTACSSQNVQDKSYAASTTSITLKTRDADLTNSLKKNEGASAVGKDDSTLFESIIADDKITIPYVKIGEVISIDFQETPPDQYELYDYILNEDGTIKYTSLATETVTLQIDKNVGAFTLNENLSSKFSSDTKDYEPGRLLRGFLLIAQQGDKQQEYAFVIKSDANKTE